MNPLEETTFRIKVPEGFIEIDPGQYKPEDYVLRVRRVHPFGATKAHIECELLLAPFKIEEGQTIALSSTAVCLRKV